MSDSEDEVQDWLQLGPQSVLKKGEKDFEPDGTQSQGNVLLRSRDAMYTALDHPRKHGKHVLKGSWEPQNFRCRVDQQRGTFLITMGVCERGIHYLNAQETLYLLQRGSLLLYLNGNLLSVEAACSYCLQGVSHAELLVYFHLKKLGYVVTNAPTEHFSAPRPVTGSRLLETLTGFTHTAFAWRRCYSSYDSIYRDMQFINQRAPPDDRSGRLTYHVWKPNTKYKKSMPPPPDFYVKVMDAYEQGMPTLEETNKLLQCVPVEDVNPRKSAAAKIKNGNRTVILAVVDSGIVSFVKVTDTQFVSV